MALSKLVSKKEFIMNANENLYLFQREIAKVVNLLYIIIDRCQNSYSTSITKKAILKSLLHLNDLAKNLKTSDFETFCLHEAGIAELRTRVKSKDADVTDYKLGVVILEDILNSVNYQIKTAEAKENNIKPAFMKCWTVDRISHFYTNESGKDFEVLSTIYDDELGVSYTIFTDFADDEFGKLRYFIATYVKVGAGVYVFPLTEEEKDSILLDVWNLYNTIDILNYYEYY
jgi:hypothetical protein